MKPQTIFLFALLFLSLANANQALAMDSDACYHRLSYLANYVEKAKMSDRDLSQCDQMISQLESLCKEESSSAPHALQQLENFIRSAHARGRK